MIISSLDLPRYTCDHIFLTSSLLQLWSYLPYIFLATPVIISFLHLPSYSCDNIFLRSSYTVATAVIISFLDLPCYISDHIFLATSVIISSSLHQWSYLPRYINDRIFLATSVIILPVIMSSSHLEEGFDQWAYVCMYMSHIQSKSFFKPTEVNLNSLHLLTWHAMIQSCGIIVRIW